MRKSLPLICILIIAILFTSCNTTRNVVYFENIKDTTFYSGTSETQFLIEPSDILGISISSLNAEASAIFNPTTGSNIKSTTVTGANTESGGYLVNPDGTIQLPVLGYIKAAGLTKKQLKDDITNLILSKKLLVSPLVEIRFLNYEVTVLGEVGKPTVITVPSEKISMLKAIGLAGDLTIYGKRENVLLIREANGQKKIVHINLNSRNFFNSPFYYLQPNDVVYVAPNKNKINQGTRNPQLIPVILSGLSVVVIILDRILR